MSNANSSGTETGSVPHRGGRGPKIERVARAYGLDGLGDELVQRWTGEEDEQLSLRELADLVNRRIVHAAQSQSGVHLLDGEAENFYRLLTDEDVTTGMRTDARRSLMERGVDVDALEDAFVSYQSVYNYLTKHRDVSREAQQSTERTVEREIESMRKLRARLQKVTADIVDRWKRSDAVDLNEYDVEVDVRVTCPDCDVRLTPSALAEAAGCDCQDQGNGSNE
jgi:hypothetical protein